MRNTSDRREPVYKYKYSTESHPQLEVHERVEAKRHEKARMKRAALALAEAEEELARLGSSKSRVHRRAARRLLQLCQTNRGVYIKGKTSDSCPALNSCGFSHCRMFIKLVSTWHRWTISFHKST